METKNSTKCQNGLYDPVAQQIVEAIASLNFGSVEVTVHEGRVVQIDRRERIRIVPPRK